VFDLLPEHNMKIFLVAAARPNFMKIAPIVRALQCHIHNNLEWRIVHTGQHYDHTMSQAFFIDLGIPEPDRFLDAGSGTHATQTAKVMVAFEEICIKDKPDLVVVVGDVNSTLACSIVAKKLNIDVAHVEAGLRSFDMTMPEEINRIVTDSITDYFFTTEKTANENLLNEGKPFDKIHFVGNVMIDNLLYQKEQLESIDPNSFSTSIFKTQLDQFIFLTLHRPATVDNREKMSDIIIALNKIAKEIPIVFPVHPRTKKMILAFGLELSDKILQLPPLSYKESLFWWKDALFVMTDSGGLQEETTALGIPCYTIRDNTERPITKTEGTNTIIGTSGSAIYKSYQEFKSGKIKNGKIPELWDGKAAERIVSVLINSLLHI